MNPLQKEYILSLAYIYIQYGRLEDSLILLLLLKHLFPKDPLIMLLRAYAYLQLKDYSAARTEVDSSLPWVEKIEHRLSAYMMRAQALYGLHKTLEARAELDRYLKLLAETAA